MKIVRMNCPNCGGELKIEDGLETFYCQYCGQRIILAEQDKVIIRAKMFDRFLEHRERMYEKKIAAKREEQRANDRFVLFGILGFLLLAFVFIFISLILH